MKGTSQKNKSTRGNSTLPPTEATTEAIREGLVRYVTNALADRMGRDVSFSGPRRTSTTAFGVHLPCSRVGTTLGGMDQDIFSADTLGAEGEEMVSKRPILSFAARPVQSS
jgi:hypothetical protein